ncbi:hypothetical protein LPJ56_003932 [Coemansia sp. RSA 2599]|nr:hypothetical protein LPJ56_003932 [Coemansia sp. RSA 2599]
MTKAQKRETKRRTDAGQRQEYVGEAKNGGRQEQEQQRQEQMPGRPSIQLQPGRRQEGQGRCHNRFCTAAPVPRVPPWFATLPRTQPAQSRLPDAAAAAVS